MSSKKVLCVLSAPVYLIRQGLGKEPGLGENLYKYMEKDGEKPDIFDDDLPVNDIPELIKYLIMKMTAYHARDRPSADDVVSVLEKLNTEVNSSPSEVERGPALRLLQALNDKRQTTIDRIVTVVGAERWINDQVNLKNLDSSCIDWMDVEYVTCLTFASYVNDARTVRKLVKAGCDVKARDSRGRTPLHNACLSDVNANSKVVFLLQRDASFVNATDYGNDAPLHKAALAGNSDVVKTLLNHGADVDSKGRLGRTALHHACNTGDVACIHELMTRGADIEAKDNALESTPLYLAANFNHPDSIRTLVDAYKASINATDAYRNTSLNMAASKGHVEVVKTLLSYDRCDVNAKGRWDRTALHEACFGGHVACIHELMAGGALVEARESLGEGTPLHLAANRNHPDSVKTLVDVCSASINASNKHGNTALHLAAFHGNADVVRVLLSNPQCDVTIRNRLGHTAADDARNGRHDDIVALLEANTNGKLFQFIAFST